MPESKRRKVLWIAGWSILFLAVLVTADILSTKYFRMGIQTYGPDSRLSVVEHFGRHNGNVYEILGSVANEGEIIWSAITLSADLFDSEGGFVDQCRTYLRVHFPPDAQEHFKITCGGCENRTLPEFETYRVRVVDASSF